MSRRKSQEDKTVNYIESRYMSEKRGTLYVANEEVNQVWDEAYIPYFVKMWNNDCKFIDIATSLGVDQSELQLLAFDLIGKGVIKGEILVLRTL